MKKFLRALFDWTIYGISCLVPRDRNRWVFLGWRSSKEREVFAENPKYQFLQVSRERPDIKAVWIGQDAAICKVLRARGYCAYPVNSWTGIWHSLRAGYTFTGALLRSENWRYAGTSRLIQLWHSKSLKKTGFNSPYSLSRYNRFLSGHLFKEPFRFIAISEFLAPFITSDFRIEKERILVAGIPKHDVLLAPVADADIDVDSALANLIKEARAASSNRLILYGPTFRPDGSNPLESIDFSAFNDFLKGRGDICIISLHPKFSMKDWIPGGLNLSHIRFSQNDFDTYPLLPKFDMLITDYSSLCFDFLIMGKPVVRYAYDFSSFKEGMGVYDELWDVMPGPIAFTFPELLSALSEDAASYAAHIEAARKNVFTFKDGNAAARITDALSPRP